jgi:hypothetical protein
MGSRQVRCTTDVFQQQGEQEKTFADNEGSEIGRVSQTSVAKRNWSSKVKM